MASGSFNVSTSNQYIVGKVDWSSVTDTANNRSTVTATLRMWRNNTGYTTERTIGAYLTINGNQKYTEERKAVSYNSNTLIITHSVVVPHDANGSKTTTISISGSFFKTGSGAAYTINSASGTAVLNTIPRHTSVTAFSTSSIQRDRITISWSAADTCDLWQYSLNGGTSWSDYISVNGTSGSTTITGLSAGTTYSLRVTVRRKSSGLWTHSSNLSRTTTAVAAPNTPTTVSATCIQATMSWSASQTAVNVQYRLSSSGSWINTTTGDFSARTSDSFTITNLTPGTAYSISVRVKDAVHKTWSGASGARAMTTWRLSTYTVSSTNSGQPISVDINRSNANMTHDVTLQYYYAPQGDYIDWITLKNQGTKATFTPTAAQWNTFYNHKWNHGRNNLMVRVVNKWNNGTVQGTNSSDASAILTIVDANPTLDSVSYSDINTAVQAVLNNDQKILRNNSDLQVVAGLAKSQKGAILSSYKVNIGGNEYTATATGTSQTGRVINVGKVNQSSNQTAVLTVTDSRGYTVSRNFTVQMLDYANPQFVSVTPERLNNYEEPSYLKAEARRTIVKPSDVDVNTMELRYRIKQNPDGEYGDFIDVVSTNGNSSGIQQHRNINQYMADYPNTQSYTIEVSIRDKFTDWKSTLVTLPEGIALMKFKKDFVEIGNKVFISTGDGQEGIGIGKENEGRAFVEVGGALQGRLMSTYFRETGMSNRPTTLNVDPIGDNSLDLLTTNSIPMVNGGPTDTSEGTTFNIEWDRGSDGYLTQFLVGLHTPQSKGRMFTRGQHMTTWQPWKEIAVYEYGETSNGWYKKYADGTMESHMIVTGTINCSSVWGALFAGVDTRAHNFPGRPFISKPVIQVSMYQTTSVSLIPMSYTAPALTVNSISNLSIARGTSSASVPYEAHITANGRWY